MSTTPIDSMSEAATPAPDEGAAGAAAAVVEVVGTLVKALRAYQMYEGSSPVYHRFLDELRAAFQQVWTWDTTLRLSVEESGLVWEGRPVGGGDGKDSLAFRFYRDGVRYLIFRPGFEEEVDRLLDVIARARRLGPDDEDDLVTLLWQEEFDSFQYGYVDLLADDYEPTRPDTAVGESFELIPPEKIAAELGPMGTDAPPAAAPSAFGAKDFKETLYFLDPDETEAIRAEIEHEWTRDLRAPVISALFDRLEDPVPSRQLEILDIIHQLLPAFLGRGELGAAASVLRELTSLLEQDGVLDADGRRAARRIFDELSEPSTLVQLLRALEDGGIDPRSDELSLFLAHLRPTALPPLLETMETTQSSPVRDRLRPAVDRLAGQYPESVIELLGSGDSRVAAGAARTAGRLRLAAAVPRLRGLLRHGDAGVRLAAVEALVLLRTAPSLEALQHALDDDAREVRIAAARGLGTLRYQPARARLDDLLKSKAVREADITEKLAFFEAYAAVAGVDAVPLLDRLLNGKGVLGRRQPPELRACAATALGRIESPAARAALQQAAQDADIIVRSAVQRALRREWQPS